MKTPYVSQDLRFSGHGFDAGTNSWGHSWVRNQSLCSDLDTDKSYRRENISTYYF